RARALHRLRALLRRLPGGLHLRRARGEGPPEPGLARRALRPPLRDQPHALHLLRLLRRGLPHRGDHPGAALRARRLPAGAHRGDQGGPARGLAELRGRQGPEPAWRRRRPARPGGACPRREPAARLGRGRVDPPRGRRADRPRQRRPRPPRALGGRAASPQEGPMTTATLLAYVVAGVALVSAAGVVLSARTIYSALCLVGNMVSLAVLFLLLNAQFVAAVQVIIYAGAVMVLFVFIIALLDPGHDPDYEGPRRDPRLWVGIVAVGYITAQVFALAVNGTTYSKTDHVLQGQRLAQAAQPSDLHSFAFDPASVNAAGNVQVLGRELFTTFLLPFEITSLLL